jgi:hypothetical protein
VPGLGRVSASAVEAYRRCPRVWYYDYVLRQRGPSSPSQLKGTGIHFAIEHYLKTAEVLPFVDVDGDGKVCSLPFPDEPANDNGRVRVQTTDIMQAAVDYLPPPLTNKEHWAQPGAGLMIEQPIELPTYEGGPTWIGYIDRVEAYESAGKVSDNKTTSDLRYAKTPEELSKNTQLACYAKWVFINSDYAQLDLEHLYLTTRGKAKAKLVGTTVTREQVDEVWTRDLALVREMDSWAALGPPNADPLPPNTEACGDFGGCFHRSKCGLEPKPLIQIRSRGNMTTKPGKLLERLKDFQAKDAPALPGKVQPAGSTGGTVSPLLANLAAKSGVDIGNVRIDEAPKAGKPEDAAVLPPDAPPRTSSAAEVAAANQPKKATKAKKKDASATPLTDSPQEEAVLEQVLAESAPAPAADERRAQSRTTLGVNPTAMPCKLEEVYIDCLPSKLPPGLEVISIEEIMGPVALAAATLTDPPTPDVRFIKYEAKAHVAAALRLALDTVPPLVSASSGSSWLDVFMEVCAPYARRIVRGVR